MKAERFSISNQLMGEDGGIAVRAIILVATLAIVGAAIYFLLVSFGRDQEADHRKALAISEYGLQIGLEQLNAGKTIPNAIPKTLYDNGWFTVSFDRYLKSDTVFLAVRSVGRSGSESEQRECILRMSINGNDTAWSPEAMR